MSLTGGAGKKLQAFIYIQAARTQFQDNFFRSFCRVFSISCAETAISTTRLFPFLALEKTHA